MQTWQENWRKAIFYFSKYSVSLSQSSVDTIRKSKAIGKITLYVISQGCLTPCVIIFTKINAQNQFWAFGHFICNWWKLVYSRNTSLGKSCSNVQTNKLHQISKPHPAVSWFLFSWEICNLPFLVIGSLSAAYVVE